MKKTLLCSLISLIFLLTLCLPVLAAQDNTCGETITWSFADGTLTITGAGKMSDFPDGTPWAAHKDQITRVVFTGGVTYVGAHALQDCDNLLSVDFGDSMYEIGEEAFMDCDNLTQLYLPASFKVFGPGCLRSCDGLTAIHCEGPFPSFRSNCLWDTYTAIYYPADRPWGLNYIQQLEEAFHGRIEFLASDGSDPYAPIPEPPTDPPTEPPTEPPTDPPTEPPTNPPTQPPTDAPAQPSTEATRPQDPTVTPTVPNGPEAQSQDLRWLLWVLGGMILLLAVWLVLNILAAWRKPGRYAANGKRRRK